MRNRIAMSVAVVLSACTPSQPAPVTNAAAHHPDISGFWELVADSKQVGEPELTPFGKEETVRVRPKVDNGEILIFASRWCQPLGTPFIMGDSAPLDILQTGREIAII